MKLILASSSPRRKILLTQLLRSLGTKHPRFHIVHANINETRRNGEKPLTCARRLAKEKALNVAQKISTTANYQLPTVNSLIIAADTIVVLGNQIFGKPRNKKHAAWMLSRLSGRRHQVITAVCVLASGVAKLASRPRGEPRDSIIHSTSTVLFHKLPKQLIQSYVSSPEPHDKAGAYAIQGSKFKIVEKIEGSYTNVVGLPLEKIRPVLKKWLRLQTSTHARK